MEKRTVFTKIWMDEWFANLSRAGKLLFLYSITNQYLGFSGYYECPDRQIMFDTSLNASELEEAKKELSPKVLFHNSWVFVRNAEKLDPIKGDNNPLWKAHQKELDRLPEEIKRGFKGATEGLRSPTGIGKVKESKGESVRGEAETLISIFNREFGKQYQLTSSRQELIAHRLRVYGLQQLEIAVKNLAKSPFHRGKNDRKWVATPDYLFRNDENVDKALNLEVSKPKEKTSSIMELVKGLNANA